ncbi:hypothetical protein [Aurantibacillus circumpalustris]|uniref:hypothetical protein n=1 Tax=Aurantibacillus circumpalustris TaxID=3036359 RepID=UPI00295C04AD|nr:hypothetical protein [Aurantibacillus circumpalustris]
MKLGLNFIAVWFGIIMIIVVLGGAIAIAFTDVFSDRLFGLKRVFFVFMLIAYAVYRGFRLYHLLNQRKYRGE